jgi:predicted metal-dependent phosphoesterase TrpH
MINAFNAIGIDLTFEEVKQYAGEDLVSRVHFAQALIQRGIVQDLSEAFEKYLGKGACCYRDRFRYSPEDCLQLINNAGGIVMMAHPLSLTTDWVLLEAEIEKLKALGLRGMECFYSTYDLDTTIHLLRIAKRFELIPSVGSDFHGLPKPTIFLGQQHVPEEIEQNLLHALSQTYFGI